MRTKPVIVVPEKAVRNYIAGILQEGKMRKLCGIDDGREVGFHEVWEWEDRPVFSDPHYRKVTFHGRTHLSAGWAYYEGEFGEWIVDLDSEHGDSSKEGRKQPCTKVCGAPYCTKQSDEWHETQEQKRERLTRLFELYPFNESPNDRWSWRKVS